MGPLPVANPHNHPPSRTAQENINNTPVNTEVLWGGGLWWGLLRASAPTAHHVQEVFDVDDTVTIGVT